MHRCRDGSGEGFHDAELISPLLRDLRPMIKWTFPIRDPTYKLLLEWQATGVRGMRSEETSL